MSAGLPAPPRPGLWPGLMLGVPAYFHPLDDPAAWQRMTALAPLLRFVVVNPHNGPGSGPEPGYAQPARLLAAAGVRTVGYVDTGYGSSPVADVAEQVAAYRSWYAVHGVLLDQVSSGLADVDRYQSYATSARAAGARFIVLNPGTLPHPAYLALADVVITFEGPWPVYRVLPRPDWVLRWPATRFCHLVYDIPADSIGAAVHAATRQHAATVYLTNGNGPNPWQHLPTFLTPALLRPAVARSAHADLDVVAGDTPRSAATTSRSADHRTDDGAEPR